MKLLSTKEVADKKQAETARDILRSQEVKNTLERLTSQLNEAEAKFNVALANQRVRWIQEEEAAMNRIKALTDEVEVLEKRKAEALVPIEEREQKSYDLETEAEQTADLLQEKLDAISDREADVTLREQRVLVREKALEEERALLSINLSNIK